MSLEESETECPDADHSGGSCIDILGVWNLFDFFLSNKKNRSRSRSPFVDCSWVTTRRAEENWFRTWSGRFVVISHPKTTKIIFIFLWQSSMYWSAKNYFLLWSVSSRFLSLLSHYGGIWDFHLILFSWQEPTEKVYRM